MKIDVMMQVISVIDTDTGVKVSHRAFPAGVQMLFFSALVAFMGFVLVNVDLANGTWLPPFDRLPQSRQNSLCSSFVSARDLRC